MKVDSTTIGNHEWDKKEVQLRKLMTNELGRYSKNSKRYLIFNKEIDYYY